MRHSPDRYARVDPPGRAVDARLRDPGRAPAWSSSTRWRTRSACPRRCSASSASGSARVAINRYPARCVADVIAALATYVDLPAGCKLMLGNGSDELISLLALACDVPGATILAPLPGFVMYEMSARLQGLKLRRRAADARASSSTRRRCWRRSSTHRPALTYIAYPEQPDREPVRRRRGRAHRRRRRRAGRPGRLRRGLPAVLVALLDGARSARCRTSSSCARSASSASPASASATSPGRRR